MFFSKNLKFLRQKENLNQKDFGNKINLTRDTIASLENNRMKPSFDVLIKLRNYFQINLDDLIFKNLKEEEEIKKWKFLTLLMTKHVNYVLK